MKEAGACGSAARLKEGHSEFEKGFLCVFVEQISEKLSSSFAEPVEMPRIQTQGQIIEITEILVPKQGSDSMLRADH